ncbi:MAG: class I SAM-dependent methyltransferase [Deltaproteobacteria bacterium]|nr:class I SAM-dependent methyltransferase [Deltaproteobacteria bacterium]
MSVQCPLCAVELSVPGHRGVADFEHGLPVTTDFASCPSCGLMAQDPTPSSSELAGYYPSDYRPHAVVGASGRAGIVASLKAVQGTMMVATLRKHLPSKATPILELGCGAGHFLRALARAGYEQLVGVDRDPAPTRFAGTGIEYRAIDLDKSVELGGPWGAIVMNYVVEHFEDPERVLRACRAALAPGGKVIALTPNTSSWSHRIFGRYWSGLHAPRHTQLFNPVALEKLAKKVGFTRCELFTPSDPASWALSLQNLVEDRLRDREAPHAGTAWYSLALMPAFYPVAVIEKLAGRGSGIFAVMSG